jgi:RNA 2',3'-cyclic 3'-phosphodiesterase
MPGNPHYFLAVSLPDSIKGELNQLIPFFQKNFLFNKWVHFEDYHITLAFLGFVTEPQLKNVKELVANQIEDELAFSLALTRIGTFGMKHSPRIFWVGLNESRPLDILRDKVYLACSQAGFQLEKRPFHPHITVARQWASDTAFNLDLLDTGNVFQVHPLSFQATEVVLYKTNLLQTPKYEKLITFSL